MEIIWSLTDAGTISYYIDANFKYVAHASVFIGAE